ncbi:E3 ubiquitin-protein ligase TRIM21-like [Sardina pilchardus]|uniref:E3 ubiquitin-protein ligase TRIM21-like n=1 Tax=Sardina pilchardus TaxID=27697 RepID=UPI002E112245
MSDDIYDDPDSSSINIRPCDNTENIYMNAVPKRSQQRMKHSEIQDRSGDHNHGPYKLAVVFLGLLCVLLLVVIIGLCTTTEEARLRLETNIRDMAGERDKLQSRLWKLESDDMKKIKSHAVDVILDPDTAHRYLLLSADGKQVRFNSTRRNVPDNPKRFSSTMWLRVLGKQGFSAGKFYYEVQVKGKTWWDLGVAKESVNRTGDQHVSTEGGYWAIWLFDGTYAAGPWVSLSLKEKLQRVGVFVDYEAGLVSFYDADCWDHLYSYTNVTFTEKLYPFFDPSYSNGRNSSPLIISPVSICPIK